LASKIRFYDLSLRETKVLSSPEPCVHELALSPDRSRPSGYRRDASILKGDVAPCASGDLQRAGDDRGSSPALPLGALDPAWSSP
jgi:hypothetical protein